MTVTPAACDHLLAKLTQRSNDVAVRMTCGGRQIRFRPSRQRSGDDVFMHEGRPVLFLTRDVAKRFEKRVLDVRDVESVPRLRFRRAK